MSRLRVYSENPQTELKYRRRKAIIRQEMWLDRVVRYIFCFVLGAFCMLAYFKWYVGV